MNGLMAITTERAFGEIFARLALQLRWLDADEAAILSYFAVLKDLPANVLTRSAEQLAAERGRKYFPTTGEWRDCALRVQQEMLREELGTERDWKVECERCDDTGWMTDFKCGGGENDACGRPRRHLPHTFARECPCRPTNRTYQRHRQSEVKGA